MIPKILELSFKFSEGCFCVGKKELITFTCGNHKDPKTMQVKNAQFDSAWISSLNQSGCFFFLFFLLQAPRFSVLSVDVLFSSSEPLRRWPHQEWSDYYWPHHWVFHSTCGGRHYCEAECETETKTPTPVDICQHSQSDGMWTNI